MPKRIIEDFTGAKKEMDCIGCAITEAGKDQPGHIIGFDEFTDEEAAEFIGLVREIRRAQRQVLGIETVYFIQEENNIGSHFHLWFLPRYEWMNDEAKFGKKLNSARPVLQFSKTHMKTPKNIAAVKEAAEKLRLYLNK